MTEKKSNSRYVNIPGLQENCSLILDKLGLEYTKVRHGYLTKCPVHGSHQWKCNIIVNDAGIFWRCYTRNCELKFGKSIVGLISGTLEITIREAFEWLCQLLDAKGIEYPSWYYEKRREVNLFSPQNRKTTVNKSVPIKAILRYLGDQDYFLSRGFSKEILDRFYVGRYLKQDSKLYGRYIIPLIEENGETLIGLTGRTPYEKQSCCNKYHHPNDSCENGINAKWLHSDNLNLQEYLFNLWNAKHIIQQTGQVILVEGCGDVLKLEEAGICNSLALMGLELKFEQRIKLVEYGVRDIILLLDNDEAGISAKKKLQNILHKSFNLYCLEYPAKDIGELDNATIRKILT